MKRFKIIAFAIFIILFTGRVIYIANEDLKHKKINNPFILGNYFLEDPYDKVGFLNKFQAQIIDKIYVNQNRYLVKTSLKRLNLLRTELINKQEYMFPQAWSLANKINSISIEQVKKKYTKKRNEYTNLQKKWLIYQKQKIIIDQCQNNPQLINFNNLFTSLKEVVEIEQETIITNGIPKIKEDIQAIKNSQEVIKNLKKEYLYQLGMYYFYQQQIEIIDTRINDYLVNGSEVADWYNDKIQGQYGAFQFIWPVIPSFGISAGFKDPGYKNRFGVEHLGFDIETKSSEEVYAIADGEVVKTTNNCTFSYIKIKHDYGYDSLYGHTIKHKVIVGDKVKRGDLIGYSDGYPGNCGSAQSTGRHLHMELFLDNERIDPLYHFDITFVPIERMPNYFDMEKYYKKIAHKDFDNDGIENMYELAINKNIYKKEPLSNNDLLIVTNSLELDLKNLLGMI